MGFVLGAIAAFAVIGMLANTVQGGPVPWGNAPGCVVTLWFLQPDGVGGELIDGATGGGGFSHVIVGGCELDDDGRELVYDCQPGAGVHRAQFEQYKDRVAADVRLIGPRASEFLGCLRAKVGTPYGAVTCASLVRDCAPPRMRAAIDSYGEPTPNSLAYALGISPDNPTNTIEVS